MKSRNVVVTGSTRGLGLSIAKKFFESGDHVTICGSSQDSVKKSIAELSPNGSERITGFSQLLDTKEGVEGLGRTVSNSKVDVLILNLGSGAGKRGWDVGDTEWNRLWNLNFNSARWTLERLVPQMSKEGSASVIFISSIAGLEVIDAPVAYVVAKAAIQAYAKMMSHVLAAEKIRVNVVCPGNLMTVGGFFYKKRQSDPVWLEKYLDGHVPQKKVGETK